MFVDLVGSTALSARLDPEDMREVIRGYQNTVAGEIARFEGHVAKFMGDRVLAYFGWPRGHEDDAERAVRAGSATVQAVGSMSTPQGQPLAARVGIATGLVVVGDLIGDTEASAHLSRGLELLEALPGTRERAQLKLELLIPLGQALSVTRGRGSPEVERTYARAWELCRNAGDASQALSVFLGLWGRPLCESGVPGGARLGGAVVSTGERVSDPGALAATAGYMLGGTA
jgi:hypothetical protein